MFKISDYERVMSKGGDGRSFLNYAERGLPWVISNPQLYSG